jgi:hypothetical protein
MDFDDAECAMWHRWAKENKHTIAVVHTGDAKSSSKDLNHQVYSKNWVASILMAVIVDDASHGTYTIHHVAPGCGIRIIEDIHSSCRSWTTNNIGTVRTGLKVQGTPKCMEPAPGEPTIIYAMIVITGKRN